MYLRDLWASFVRRWYLVLGFLLVSAALMTAASMTIEPSYESTASLVLVPPPNPESPSLNRYLDLGGLSDAVAVLAKSMSSDQLQAQFAAEVAGADYEVGADVTTSAPILVVTAKAHGRADSSRLLGLVLQRVPANLADLQTALKITQASQQITAVTVSQDPPKRVEKTRLRLLGALGVALLVGSALMVALLDGLLLRRKSSNGEPVTLHALEGKGKRESGDPSVKEPEREAADSEARAGRAVTARRGTSRRRKVIRPGRESRSGSR